MKPKPALYTDWGRTEYSAALERQRALLDARVHGEIPDTLVFTEHDPVFTLGARRGADAHILLSESVLKSRGIALAKTNRGGDATYHGPGQLVGYPIVSLDPRRDLHAYLRLLEQTLISALRGFGLKAGRRRGLTGVWVGKGKIAAIGVAVRSWVAWHGFALNVDCDLAAFDGIIPCGLTPDQGHVTSMSAELPKSKMPTPEKIKTEIAKEFWKLFKKYLAEKSR